MAIKKPKIPGLYPTQLIGFFSVFITISVLGPLHYLTRPILTAGILTAQAVVIYWLVCSVRQKKTGYALLMIFELLLANVIWYLAYHYLCIDA